MIVALLFVALFVAFMMAVLIFTVNTLTQIDGMKSNMKYLTAALLIAVSIFTQGPSATMRALKNGELWK